MDWNRMRTDLTTQGDGVVIYAQDKVHAIAVGTMTMSGAEM